MRIRPNLITILIVVPLAILFTWLIGTTIHTAKMGRLEERFHSLVLEVDTRCEEFIGNENPAVHLECFLNYFEIIDARNNVFSAVYNNGWDIVSKREETFSGQPFNPLKYENIINMMYAENSGIGNAPFTVQIDGTERMRPIQLYFRKVIIDDKIVVTPVVGMPFTDDNAELTPQLYIIIYGSYLSLLLAASIGVFLVSHYLSRYRNLITAENYTKGTLEIE